VSLFVSFYFICFGVFGLNVWVLWKISVFRFSLFGGTVFLGRNVERESGFKFS
jgi:hypothetical protein